MSTAPEKSHLPAGLMYGEPVWEIARLYPAQGCWTEREYLDLETNRFVEFSDGYLEFPEMPTLSHQLIVMMLQSLLREFVMARGLGRVVIAPYKVRLWPGKYREPDVVFVRAEHEDRLAEECSDGADLVIEVLSHGETDRHRDLVEKRAEYARAGIAEYWMVDPREERIVVLTLVGPEYVEHGAFLRGQRATSRLLPGFTLDVNEALDAR